MRRQTSAFPPHVTRLFLTYPCLTGNFFFRSYFLRWVDDFQTKSFSRAWTAFCGRPAQQKSSDRFLHRAFDFGTVTHSRCMLVCLLCSLRQCRLHCYCLLDWNAHAHQHIMRKGGRAIWTFGSITDWTVIFFLPFVALFFERSPHHPPSFFFPCTIPAPHGGFSDLFVWRM